MLNNLPDAIVCRELIVASLPLWYQYFKARQNLIGIISRVHSGMRLAKAKQEPFPF